MSVSVSGGPGSCRGTRTPCDRVLQAEVAGKRPDHRQIHAHGRRRRRPRRRGHRTWPGAGRRRRSRPRRDRRPRAGGRARRPASRRRRGRSPRTAAACSPTPPGRRSARPRRTGCAPRARERTGGGEGERTLADATVPALETSSTSTSSSSAPASTARERELQLAHRERLFPKPPMPGHVKPRLGRQEPLEPVGPQDPNNGVFGPDILRPSSDQGAGGHGSNMCYPAAQFDAPER